VTRSALAGGAAEKLVTEELGGPGYLSLNLYRTAQGPLLRPCETTEEAAIRLVCALVPERG
jgi:hypothetical protein